MPASNAAWGIEVGSYAVKALRLERDGDGVAVTDFAYIPHKKVLSTPDLDRDEMSRLSLGQFNAQQRGNDGAPVVMSVPGNSAFARFAKLPPVEPKKVPDIVRFEAVQQIPFPIEEVEWDYQTFTSEATPDVEVGIFAMTKAAVQKRLALLGDVGISPDGLTLSPISVFNGMTFDLGLDDSSAGVIILDIGTESTDLIIAEQGRCWIRTFPIGGHNFTDALISSFKLTYSKAEKLKSEAQTSKYRRQILSAMRPVFADLAQDVQRSIGYYQSMHSDADLKKLVGVGSTFKLPGLRKFLSQQLQMDVVRVDEFERLKFAGPTDSNFADHTVSFATAYGLALQGLDQVDINVNLVPVQVVRERMWQSKIKWFGAAAAVAVVGGFVSFVRPMADKKFESQPPQFTQVNSTLDEANRYKVEFDEITESTETNAKALNIRKMLAYRDIWSHVITDMSAMVASANPQPELFSGDAETINTIPPGERRLISIEKMSHQFSPAKGGEGSMPRIRISLQVQTTNSTRVSFINSHMDNWIREHANRPNMPYRFVVDSDSPKVGGVQTRDIRIVEEESDTGGSNFRPRGGPSFGEGGGGFGGKGGGGMSIGEGPPGVMGEHGGGGPTIRGGSRGANSDVEGLAPLPELADIYPDGTSVTTCNFSFDIELIADSERTSASPDNREDK